MKKVIFISAIVLGIFFRLYALGEVPAGLFSDEVSIAVNAKAIAEDGVDEYGRSYPYAFESLSDYKMPGYIYPTAFFYTLFGATGLTVRITAALFSIASIFLLLYFVKLLFPQKRDLPYIAMAVLAVCLFHIHFSRIAFESMVATTWLLVFAIAVLQTLRGSRKTLWLVIGSLAIAFATWTYPAPRFIIPVTTVLFYALLLMQKENRRTYKSHLLTVGIFLLATFLSFLPSIINPLVDKRPLTYLFYDTNGTIFEVLIRKVFSVTSSVLWSFNLEFLFAKGDTFAFRHGTRESGVFLGVFLVPFLLGVFVFLKQWHYKNQANLFLLVFFVVCTLPSALTSSTPYGPRFLPMVIPLTVIVALGIDQGIGFLAKQKRILQLLATLLFSGIFVYQIFWFGHAYFVHYAQTSLPEFPQPSKLMALKVKKALAEDTTRQIYFLTDRNCRSWSHDDLHLWYFADLDNKDMIIWNNEFREKRYAFKNGSPFDAYDAEIPNGVYQKRLFLYAENEVAVTAPKGSLFVRCGVHLNSINTKEEKIIDVLYLYPREKREPFYVFSEKL